MAVHGVSASPISEPRLAAGPSPPPPPRVPLQVADIFDQATGLSRGSLEYWFGEAVRRLIAGVDIAELERELVRYGNLDRWLADQKAIRSFEDFRSGFRNAFEGSSDKDGRRSSRARAAIVQTFVAGADVAVQTSRIANTWFKLDRWLERAIKWIDLNAANRITGIDQRTADGIRAIVSEAFKTEGVGMAGIKRALLSLDGSDGKVRFGLDASRAKSLNKYIAELVDPVKGADYSAKRIQQLIDRRYRQLLRDRAGVIALTESVTAANAGQVNAYQVAAQEGALSAETYILEWVARTIACLRCKAFDTSTREITGGVFISDGSGPKGVESVEYPDIHPGGFCFLRSIRRTEARRPPIGHVA